MQAHRLQGIFSRGGGANIVPFVELSSFPCVLECCTLDVLGFYSVYDSRLPNIDDYGS